MKSVIKPRALKPLLKLPLINKENPVNQRGGALIAAIFVITALAALGGLMTQLLVLGSEETIDEWYSTQALYAAESGVEWAVWDLTVNGNTGTTTDTQVINQSWMTTTVTTVVVNGNNLYTITSTGTAGGAAATPRTQRQIVVQYMQ